MVSELFDPGFYFIQFTGKSSDEIAMSIIRQNLSSGEKSWNELVGTSFMGLCQVEFAI